jgi:tetratricopeptide (TPR) repeat protein
LDSLFKNPGIAGDLRQIGINAPAELRAFQLLQGAGFHTFAKASGNSLNSDDRPRLEAAAVHDLFHPRPGRHENLLASLDQAASPPPYDDSLSKILAGETARRAGLFSHARAILKPAENEGRHQAEAAMTLARIDAAQNKPEPARLRLRKAIQHKPNLGQAWISLGKLELEAGNYEAALEIFEAMAAKFPSLPDPRFGRALALLRLDRGTESAAALRETLRLFPAFEPARNLLAEISPAPQ